jgi:hypothetical protein
MRAVAWIADGDPLVEGGELAEFEPAPQGGLADEQAGEHGGGVNPQPGRQERIASLTCGWAAEHRDRDRGA